MCSGCQWESEYVRVYASECQCARVGVAESESV